MQHPFSFTEVARTWGFKPFQISSHSKRYIVKSSARSMK
uniref:Uncharacterized protein n=1 Tax=Anguilla anguilla TaxID=7936 RepID=A0A0E9PLZ7_ANGAN